jgi:glutamate/tyrosine decarboxylase-like PLP-dependent enzyme
MSKSRLTDDAFNELIDKVGLETLVDKVLARKREAERRSAPMEAWFLGPKAEHAEMWLETVEHVLRDYIHWRRNYFPQDPIIIDREMVRSHETWGENFKTEIDKVLNQLKAHFPFYSPRYNAHMLSEQTLPGVVGYFATMLYNPNNVSGEAAPITVDLELEAGQMVSKMLGYDPKTSWAHITSGGTVANMEALWVARMVQFVPLMLQDMCRERGIGDFEVKQPDNSRANILDLSPSELLAQRPTRCLRIIRELAAHAADGSQRIYDDINGFIQRSRFNPSNRGMYGVLRDIGLSPVIFVSEAAHYSIKKAANVLGYGEDAVELVPVESHFRMSMTALSERLFELPDDRYVAAVIAVMGTTEEGAVDPVHRIRDLRYDLQREHNRSFWLHVDAAWGGYIRSLFCGHGFEGRLEGKDPEEVADAFYESMGMGEEIEVGVTYVQSGGNTEETRKLQLDWRDLSVYSAFLAMRDADSITVDPHKLGYVPYPAGVIAFRKKAVTELIVQKAQYIGDEVGGIKGIDEKIELENVGHYILEGSKPGAAAAACWLAAKTIPLNIDGHGKIIKETLLSTKKLARYIGLHDRLFDTIEIALHGRPGPTEGRFTFELVAEPDTNLACFVCVPGRVDGNGDFIRDTSGGLEWVNALNKAIYDRMTIKVEPHNHKPPYSQEFFVSRTVFRDEQYKAESISGLLDRLGFTRKDYVENGIFVLRSVVMNPLHRLAEKAGKDYLYDFVVELHRVAGEVLQVDGRR